MSKRKPIGLFQAWGFEEGHPLHGLDPDGVLAVEDMAVGIAVLISKGITPEFVSEMALAYGVSCRWHQHGAQHARRLAKGHVGTPLEAE